MVFIVSSAGLELKTSKGNERKCGKTLFTLFFATKVSESGDEAFGHGNERSLATSKRVSSITLFGPKEQRVQGCKGLDLASVLNRGS